MTYINIDYYSKNLIQASQDVVLMQNLKDSPSWFVICSLIDMQIESYRTVLENLDVDNVLKYKEIQYAIQNLRNLKTLPFDLINEINKISLESPPTSNDFGFIN